MTNSFKMMTTGSFRVTTTSSFKMITTNSFEAIITNNSKMIISNTFGILDKVIRSWEVQGMLKLRLGLYIQSGLAVIKGWD